MKAILLTAGFIGSTLLLSTPPVGDMFPELKAETLDDKTITFPADTKGKSTLICMAYSADAETDLRTWYEPTYDKFIAKTGLMDDMYDVNVYFIPMFTGVKALGADKAKQDMKKTVQEDLQPHVVIYRGELDAYKEKLKMDDKTKPYIYVLDKEGKILFVTSGAYTEDKMDEIDEYIE
jgi:hypothetical protein